MKTLDPPPNHMILMQRLALLLCLGLVGCSSVSRQVEGVGPTVDTQPASVEPSPKGELKTYVNQRFGFKLIYPANFRSIRRPDNGAGLTFHSPDSKFSITAQGHFLNGATLETMWADDVASEGATTTYSRKAKNSYVVSGTREGQEYYRRVFVRQGNWVRFDIVYPASERSRWDSVVEQISSDFVPFLEGPFDRAPAHTMTSTTEVSET